MRVVTFPVTYGHYTGDKIDPLTYITTAHTISTGDVTLFPLCSHRILWSEGSKVWVWSLNVEYTVHWFSSPNWRSLKTNIFTFIRGVADTNTLVQALQEISTGHCCSSCRLLNGIHMQIKAILNGLCFQVGNIRSRSAQLLRHCAPEMLLVEIEPACMNKGPKPQQTQHHKLTFTGMANTGNGRSQCSCAFIWMDLCSLT